MSEQTPSEQSQPPLTQYPPQGQLPPQGYTQYPQGYPQQPYMMQPVPPPKKKRGKGLIIGAVVVVVALALCGIVGSALTHSAAATVSGVSGSNTATASTSSPSNVVAHVGQTITIQSFSCTLVSVHKLFTGENDIAPKAGHEYIYVHVALKNTGDSEQSYNPFDFQVKTGTGDITTSEFTTPSSYTQNSELNAGTLAAGGTTSGDIIFQVPISDHNTQLTWKPSIFDNSTQYAWSLGL